MTHAILLTCESEKMALAIQEQMATVFTFNMFRIDISETVENCWFIKVIEEIDHSRYNELRIYGVAFLQGYRTCERKSEARLTINRK